MVTETGYVTNNPSGTQGNTSQFVNEDIQAKYTLDTLFDNKIQGVVKTYIYELYDDSGDTNNTNDEAHFGLFHADDTPKTAATALHNLAAIFADTGGSAATFTPTNVLYSITQSSTAPYMDATKNTDLLENSSGTHFLVFWGEPNLWNDLTGLEITNNPGNQVTVTLAAPYSAIDVYDPMIGTSSQMHLTNANSVDIVVNDHPIIVAFH
jgi:hypothetical protein